MSSRILMKLNTLKLSFFASIVFCLMSCHKDIQSQKDLYFADFENKSLENITGGIINNYNGSNVLGFYNNGGFIIKLGSLASHDIIQISFDLYLHDSWAGNNTGTIDVVDGPDIWEMEVDKEKIINTTFSNSGCFPTYCQQQSYPRNFPYHNDAGTGASRTDLPGRCHLINVSGGSTMYKISKLVNHSNKTLTIEFKDLLKQSNASDMLCDESWSIDNISIKTIALD